MRQLFRSLCLAAVLLPGLNKTFAQAVSNSFDTLGHNVIYTISAPPFSTSIDIGLFPSSTLFLSMDLMDSTNSVLSSWSPTTTGNSYSNGFNLSTLSAGSYYVNIKDTNAIVLQTIPFTK